MSAQLDFIFRDYDSEGICLGAASLDRVSQIILGLQAVREIEPGNPEFEKLLCEIDFFYKRQYGLV